MDIHHGALSILRLREILKVLHLVPKDLAICKEIQKLKHGQVASIIGHEETDNRVESSDARSYSFGSKSYGHILFLVTAIQTESG